MSKLLNHKNLKLLWWMRNVALIGQAAAILIVSSVLRIPLPEMPLWIILTTIALLNVFTWWRIEAAKTITDHEFLMQLLVDIVALAGLLYFTGGATNPFASLFILQVIIAAIALPPLYTWMIAAITVALYTSLMFWNVEMPYFLHHHIGDFFSLHVQGMWLSFIFLAGIVAWFVVQMNTTIRRQNALLAEAEKMAAVGTLAANAAHELGTPLATMAVLAEDCEQETAHKFSEQIQRCKQILSRITAAGGVARAEGGAPMGLSDFLNQTIEDWKQLHPAIPLAVQISGTGQPRIVAEHGFEQAITNLLDNAADASPQSVRLEADWTASTLNIRIQDNGAGLPETIQPLLGEVVGLTTKPDGMGLGLFLTRSVITRLEGKLTLTSIAGKGTTAHITLPLRRLTV
jgi:two-component system sensor histidine kinase RegB